MEKPIYLDYNATTPIDSEVAQAMMPYLYEHFGNPSSNHYYGQMSRKAVELARVHVAALIKATPQEIIFTSGGTEANNMVLKGVAEDRQKQGKHIITSAVEHPAILDTCSYLADRGFEITVLPVDDFGMVRPDELDEAIRPDTILVTIMLANNEVGTLQPLAEIASIAHQHNVLVHTDAAQALGKIAVDITSLGIDFLSIAGHKMYAPKGVGAIFVSEGVNLPKFMHGASHESGRRAGTENVLEIVGLGAAAEIAERDLASNMATMKTMRDKLYDGLSQINRVKRNGHPNQSLHNTLSISFEDVEANTLLDTISSRIAASAGAACHADSINVSSVLTAMQIPLNYAMGTIRLTTGKMTTSDEIADAVTILKDAIHSLRANVIS